MIYMRAYICVYVVLCVCLCILYVGLPILVQHCQEERAADMMRGNVIPYGENL